MTLADEKAMVHANAPAAARTATPEETHLAGRTRRVLPRGDAAHTADSHDVAV
jgi:hypothetical protein